MNQKGKEAIGIRGYSSPASMEKRNPFFLTSFLKRNSQTPESSEEKGWRIHTSDETRFKGWGSSIGSTSSEPITNGWADEPPEHRFNGWGRAFGSGPSCPSLETNSNELAQEKLKEKNGQGFGSGSGFGSGLTVSMHEPHAPRQRIVESWVPTLPSAPPLPIDNTDSLNEGKNNDALCVVCWEARVEGACLPCGHMASCMECLHKIESKQGTCPICRANIDKVMKIYVIQTE